MKAALGYAAVAFGAGATVVGITALLAGLQLRDQFLLRFGRRCVFAVLLAALAAAGVMEWALLSHDFSLKYVAENNATSTPLLYTITGLWAALEGSILLWAVILGQVLEGISGDQPLAHRKLQDALQGLEVIVDARTSERANRLL